MITDAEATEFIKGKFNIGEGFVELWRGDEGLGVIALSCLESKSKIPKPVQFWSLHCNFVEKFESEIQVLKLFSAREIERSVLPPEQFVERVIQILEAKHVQFSQGVAKSRLDHGFTLGFKAKGETDPVLERIREWMVKRAGEDGLLPFVQFVNRPNAAGWQYGMFAN